jgi:hypothetical protein
MKTEVKRTDPKVLHLKSYPRHGLAAEHVYAGQLTDRRSSVCGCPWEPTGSPLSG